MDTPPYEGAMAITGLIINTHNENMIIPADTGIHSDMLTLNQQLDEMIPPSENSDDSDTEITDNPTINNTVIL
jgi:hypothetical protein